MKIFPPFKEQSCYNSSAKNWTLHLQLQSNRGLHWCAIWGISTGGTEGEALHTHLSWQPHTCLPVFYSTYWTLVSYFVFASKWSNGIFTNHVHSIFTDHVHSTRDGRGRYYLVMLMGGCLVNFWSSRYGVVDTVLDFWRRPQWVPIKARVAHLACSLCAYV